MNLRWVAVLLAASTAALGADEFDHVAGAIEQHYHTRRVHIPFMGLANVALMIAHPAGVSGFQLAVFEDLDLREPGYEADLDRFMSGLSDAGLRLVVRAHSQQSGESTYIFTGEIGKSTQMLIATIRRHEARVIQATVNLDRLFAAINAPQHAAEKLVQPN